MKHIMLDLETMGNGNCAAIVAIGACEFNPVGSGIDSGRFYAQVSLQSSADAGLVMDTDTVLWWLKQSDAARKSTFEGPGQIPLGDALCRFSKWLAGTDVAVWGNGATFDNVIIRSAYKAVGLPVPWSFRDDRCYRTMTNLLPASRRPVFERSDTAHNALDDATTQALYLQRVYKELGL